MRLASSSDWLLTVAAIISCAGVASAAGFPSKLPSATVTIYDQQSTIVSNGVPVMDGSLPTTYDDTSVHLDAFYLGNLNTGTSSGGGPATGGPAPALTSEIHGFAIAIQPQGFCAALAGGGGEPRKEISSQFTTEPFLIPLSELLKVSGLPTTEVFVGLTERQPYIEPGFRTPAPGPGVGLFESQGTNLFDGDPWADVTVISTGLGGEIKLDGITDLTALLAPGALRFNVDLVVIPNAQYGQAITSATSAAPGTPALCSTVPASLVIRPTAPVDVSAF